MALSDARSKNPEAVRKAKAKAIPHIQFMIRIYYGQLDNGT